MWPLQRPHFQVERNGEPIGKHHVKHAVNPNIRFRRILPSLVPLYEEQEALRDANYNYNQWKELTWWEKALHVAHYRNKNLVRLHSEDAVSDRIERDMKRKK